MNGLSKLSTRISLSFTRDLSLSGVVARSNLPPSPLKTSQQWKQKEGAQCAQQASPRLKESSLRLTKGCSRRTMAVPRERKTLWFRKWAKWNRTRWMRLNLGTLTHWSSSTSSITCQVRICICSCISMNSRTRTMPSSNTRVWSCRMQRVRSMISSSRAS